MSSSGASKGRKMRFLEVVKNITVYISSAMQRNEKKLALVSLEQRNNNQRKGDNTKPKRKRKNGAIEADPSRKCGGAQPHLRTPATSV